MECFEVPRPVAKHSTGDDGDGHRHRFPGLRPEWARFDGPAGTQMVDSAITAMAAWMASGNTASNGGPFAAAEECQRLMDRTARRRRPTARRRSDRHRLRRRT